MTALTPSEREKRYRESMRARGFGMTRTWVPATTECRAVIQAVGDELRDRPIKGAIADWLEELAEKLRGEK